MQYDFRSSIFRASEQNCGIWPLDRILAATSRTEIFGPNFEKQFYRASKITWRLCDFNVLHNCSTKTRSCFKSRQIEEDNAPFDEANYHSCQWTLNGITESCDVDMDVSLHQAGQIFIICIFLSAIIPNVNLAGPQQEQEQAPRQGQRQATEWTSA